MQVTELGTWQLHSHPAQTRLFSDLGGTEWTEFLEDVQKRGIQQPITVSRKERGFMIVDGHQRVRAARKLELKTVPAVIVDYADEGEETFALVMANVRRRHLSRDERRAVIAEMLKLYPERSNRQHAETLGVDHKTVKSQRTELEATGEIPQLGQTVGADGKARTTTPKNRPAPSASRPNLGQLEAEAAPSESLKLRDSSPALESVNLADSDPAPVEVLPPTPPAPVASAPMTPKKEDREPWEVDPDHVVDLTPNAFEQQLQQVGWDEANRFDNAAKKAVEGLSYLVRLSPAQLLEVVNSPAGKTLNAPLRMRRIAELMDAMRDLMDASAPAEEGEQTVLRPLN